MARRFLQWFLPRPGRVAAAACLRGLREPRRAGQPDTEPGVRIQYNGAVLGTKVRGSRQWCSARHSAAMLGAVVQCSVQWCGAWYGGARLGPLAGGRSQWVFMARCTRAHFPQTNHVVSGAHAVLTYLPLPSGFARLLGMCLAPHPFLSLLLSHKLYL